jgi:trans-aconitate methyltransferase
LSSAPSPGDLYDWEQRHVIGRTDQDLPFYLDLTRRPGARVLELACGTGRITGPLAAAGVDVIGLDNDEDMLRVARRRYGHLALVAGDMRDFAFARPFDVVIAPYNCLQLLLSADDRRACLASAALHLAPQGVLAFEIRDFIGDARGVDVEPERLHQGSLDDATVTLHGGLRHDHERRVTTYTRRFEIVTDNAVHHVDDDVSLYSFAPGEIDALLAAVGLDGRALTVAGTGATRWVAGRLGHPFEPGG